MPFYEYECPSCRFYTEVMQRISDKPLKKCPSCGKGGFKRLISAPVFRLKGSGWYETDFKSDKENKRNLVGERDEAKPAEAAKPDAKDKTGDSKAADSKGATEKADSGAGKAESASTAPKAAPASSRRRNTAPARAPARKRSAPRKPK